MNLKTMRTEKNLSQQALALKSGYSQGTISNLERGMVVPSKEMKKRISRALRTSATKIWPESDQ